MKIGYILTAKNECVMSNGQKSLTIGKQYTVIKLIHHNLKIIDDLGHDHHFDLRRSNHAYYKKFFI